MGRIIIKDKRSIEKMRFAGQAIALILEHLKERIHAGVSTLALDRFIEDEMRKSGLKPECKGYGSYRHATCISVNDVVVHGVPSDAIILKDSDLVKVDVVGSYKGYCADMARFFFVGEPANSDALRLVQTAQSALDQAIRKIRPGVNLSDISSSIQEHVEAAGFGVVRRFAGHGIGKAMHEEPEIPNYGPPGRGPVLRQGMTLAIEPMITQYSPEIIIESDGWTARTADGGLAAHVEDTIVVCSDGVEILTRLSSDSLNKNRAV